MFGNGERHPPAELDHARVRRLVAGALAAVVLIALALFFGEDLFSATNVSADRTASIDTPHVKAPAAPEVR